MVNIPALKLCARFSLPPNSLGYCGRGTAPDRFISCVLSGKCGGVEKEFSKFIVLNPYLETLAKITKQPKYSLSVVGAYWLGNSWLEKAKPVDYQLLLDNFAKQGVPDWLNSDLRRKQPKKFIPFHLFQVLHVGVGRASGSVPYNLKTINNCMIRWGKVIKVSPSQLTVDVNSLSGKMGSLILKKSRAVFSYRPDFLSGIKIGDTVAIHWGQPVKILTLKETENLKIWTRATLISLQ